MLLLAQVLLIVEKYIKLVDFTITNFWMKIRNIISEIELPEIILAKIF